MTLVPRRGPTRGRRCELSNSYKEARSKKKEEEIKGHNHPVSQKCGPHCPRNEHYKGRERKIDPFHRDK